MEHYKSMTSVHVLINSQFHKRLDCEKDGSNML